MRVNRLSFLFFFTFHFHLPGGFYYICNHLIIQTLPNTKYIKLAQDYFLFLTKKKLKFDKCYLLGSCASSTETKDSDIDILLISNFFLFPDEKQLHYLYDITIDYNNKIHLHYMSLHFFNHVNPDPNNNKFSLCNDSQINFFIPIHPTRTVSP